MEESFESFRRLVQLKVSEIVLEDCTSNKDKVFDYFRKVLTELNWKLFNNPEFIDTLASFLFNDDPDGLSSFIHTELKQFPFGLRLRLIANIIGTSKITDSRSSKRVLVTTSHYSLESLSRQNTDLICKWKQGKVNPMTIFHFLPRGQSNKDNEFLVSALLQEGGHSDQSFKTRRQFDVPNISLNDMISCYCDVRDGNESLTIHTCSQSLNIMLRDKESNKYISDNTPSSRFATSNHHLAWCNVGWNVPNISLKLVAPADSNSTAQKILMIGHNITESCTNRSIEVDKALSVDTISVNGLLTGLTILIRSSQRTQSQSEDISSIDGESDFGEDDENFDKNSYSGEDYAVVKNSPPCILYIKYHYYVVFCEVIDDSITVTSILPLKDYVLVDQLPSTIVSISRDKAVVYGSNALLCLVLGKTNRSYLKSKQQIFHFYSIEDIHNSSIQPNSRCHALDSHITSVSFNASGDIIVTADDQGMVCCWTITTTLSIRLLTDSIFPQGKRRINDVTMSPNGMDIAVVYFDRLLILSFTNEIVSPTKASQNSSGNLLSLYVRSIIDIVDGYRAVYKVYFQDSVIRVWRIMIGVKFQACQHDNSSGINSWYKSLRDLNLPQTSRQLSEPERIPVESGISVTTWLHGSNDASKQKYAVNFKSEYDDNKCSDSLTSAAAIGLKGPGFVNKRLGEDDMTPPASLPLSRCETPTKDIESFNSTPFKVGQPVRGMMNSPVWQMFAKDSTPYRLSRSTNYFDDNSSKLPEKGSPRAPFAASPIPSDLSSPRIAPPNKYGIFRVAQPSTLLDDTSREYYSPLTQMTNESRFKSTTTLDDVAYLSSSRPSSPLVSSKFNSKSDWLLRDLIRRTYGSISNRIIIPVDYRDNDILSTDGYCLDYMRKRFQHDMSESFLRVKLFLSVYCASFTAPSVGLISAALDVEPFCTMNLVEYSPLSQILYINSSTPRSTADELLVQEHLKPLQEWLISSRACRIGREFWIDASIGHNHLFALHLRYCGNKSVAVECVWQDYLRVYGSSHLRHCSRGLRELTQNIRKIDETVGIKESLPPQIGYVSGLQEIYARRVGLCGRLPNELGELNQLRVLSMGNNRLCGELPSSLGNLKKLQRIVLHQNLLTGKVPESIGNLGCIVNLAGNLGLEPGNEVPEIQRDALVDLFYATSGPKWNTKINWLTPQPVFTWYKVGVLSSNVHSIVMSSNGMEGRLPPSIGRLSQLRMIELATMPGLTGTIPIQLCTITSLRRLCICRCGLLGPIPDEIGQLINLEELQLFGNSLSGLIPSTLGNLSELKLLSLGEYTGGNSFVSAPLPICIGKLRNLEALFLANCNLKGAIPHWLGELTELRQLDLQRNYLQGSLPESIGNLQNLLYLNLKDNEALTGSLPIYQMASLTKLNRLSLVHCNFANASASVEILQSHLPLCKIWT